MKQLKDLVILKEELSKYNCKRVFNPFDKPVLDQTKQILLIIQQEKEYSCLATEKLKYNFFLPFFSLFLL